MPPVSDWELVGRLVLAAALGFFIGLEREFRGQAAGERTHALVCLGAAGLLARAAGHAVCSGSKSARNDVSQLIQPLSERTECDILTAEGYRWREERYGDARQEA